MQKNSFITTLVLSVLFGFAAGAVGMIVVAAYVLPTPSFPSTSPAVLRGRLAGAAQDETAPSVDPARASVLFVPRNPHDAGAPVRTYVSTEAFGAGIVLTSDGWLLTSENVFSKGRPQDAIALVGAKAYPIKEVVKDAFSGVFFLKIDGSNLPVTAFGQGADLASGGFAFAFDRDAGLHRLGVLAYDRLAVGNASDLAWSSERLQKIVHVSGADDLLFGAMVMNKKGEVVGVLAGKDARAPYVVPFEAFSGVISGVLRDKRAVRPYLGARFVDLSQLLAPEAKHAGGRGAMLVGFTKKSPAELAGLAAGEVIEAVNGEEVTVKNSFPELLAEYQPGSVLTLTVRGAKGERKVDVTLTATK